MYYKLHLQLRPTLTANNNTNIPVLGKPIASVTHKITVSPVMFIIADTNSQAFLDVDNWEKLQTIKQIFNFHNCGSFNSPCDQSSQKDFLCFEKENKSSAGQNDGIGHHQTSYWTYRVNKRPSHSGKAKLLSIYLSCSPQREAIKRECFQLPTAEEIFLDMHGTKYFFNIDANNGLWQISVDKESLKPLTFNTPFGHNKCNRLPDGMHSAREIFQYEIDCIIEGIQGARNVQVDIIV